MTGKGTTVKIRAIGMAALVLGFCWGVRAEPRQPVRSSPAPVGSVSVHRLEIPSSFVMERKPIELSRGHVFRAIQAALLKNGFPGASQLRPADVQFQMPLKLTRPHPIVRVIGAAFDPELQMAVFRLETANEAGMGPFDAIVRPVDGLKAWLEPADAREAVARNVSFLARTTRDSAWRARRPRGKPVVMPLQMVNLVLITGSMEIHTVAETLEPGYLGQVIRVRMNKTRQIFRARVIAPDYLEAQF